ncbi:MAG: hypothetical protein WKF37_01755 [Bryobacteraceae bacterium]
MPSCTDPVFVDDAVEAFLRAGTACTKKWRVYNIAGPEALTTKEIADVITRIALTPPAVKIAYPCSTQSIDIGSFASDLRRASCGLGWTPTTRFEPGIRETFEYYKAYAREYLDGPMQVCR